MVADCGHDEVGAVCRYHRALSEARTGIMLLNDGVNTDDGDENAEREIERDEEPVQSASRRSEERVHHTRQRDRCGVHSGRGTNENPLPHIGRR